MTMVMMEDHIGAGEFKAKCLRLLDEVARRRAPLVITKHGKPVAKLVPVDDPPELVAAVAAEKGASGDDDIVGFIEAGSGAA